MSEINIKIALVPEQVNIPLKICLENNYFSNVKVELIIVPEGTGKMLEMLHNQEVDIALLVTDAFITAKANNKEKWKQLNLCGVYVFSPLIWAICGTGIQHSFMLDVGNVGFQGTYRWGISRLGSGSHTMALYKSALTKKDNKAEFVIANNFTQLREGVNRNDFDSFLWETFTTKPYFDNGEISKLGEVSAPWPAFSFVTNVGANEENKQLIIKDIIFPGIKKAIDIFTSFNNEQETINRIVHEFKHTETDAKQWLSSCKYNNNLGMSISTKQINESIKIMKELGLIPTEFITEELWADSRDNNLNNKIVTFVE